jgi:hypothetical protein
MSIITSFTTIIFAPLVRKGCALDSLECVVVVRWSKELFEFFILLVFILLLMIINRLVDFFEKKNKRIIQD